MAGQSIFIVQAMATGQATLPQLVERIDALLDDIRRDGPSEAEIRRAVAFYETGLLTSLDGLRGFERTARTLQLFNQFRGESNWLAQDVARYEAVGADGR